VIAQETVRALVHADVSYKVYELSEALACRDYARALLVLQTCLQQGEEQIMLLGLLYAHFRRMLCVTLAPQSDLVQTLGIKEYAVTVLRRQSKAFGARELRRIVGVFWRIDADFRAGKLPLDSAVQHAIFCIANAD
jgi:DNA polymerase III delta subunit